MSTITTATEVTSGGGGGGGGAPDDATYLTATSNGTLSAEVVVGTSPGGELGGTWSSPTVDATHSGTTHAATQAAAEATAASALAAHEADTTSIHGITDTSALYAAGGTDVAVADGGTGASTASGARTNLGLVIATDVEAHDADLTTIAGLTPTNDDIIQRKAGAWTNRTMAQLATDLGLAAGYQPLDSDLTSIAALSTTSFGRSVLEAANAAALATLAGVGTGDSPQVTALNVGHATDTTITRTGSGDIAVEGNALYRAGGTDVPVTDGGTGASTASAARTSLGVAIGSDVQAYDPELAALAGLTSAADKVPYFTGSGSAAVADFTSAGRALVDDADAAAQRTTLGLGSLATASSIAHSATTGQTANDHHNQSHDHSSAGDGTSLSPATLVLPAATSPAQTAEGSVVWDSDDDVLTIGDGASRKTFGKLGSTVAVTQALGDSAAAGTSVEASRVDHKHAMPNSTAGPDADITIDAAGAAGTASTAARAAHGHKLTTYSSAPTSVDSTAASAGTSTTAPARGDHRHLGHNQSHNHSASADGTALAPVTLTLPPRVSDPTTDGEIVWYTSAEVIQVGKGGDTAYFFPIDNGAGGTLAFGSAGAAGTANGTPRSDHAHPMPTLGYGLSGNSAPAVGLTTAEAFATAETTLSTAAYADIAGATITLAAGTWLVIGTINGRVVNAHALMVCAITDASNNVVANGVQSIPASGSASVNAHGQVVLSAIVTPGGSTAYKLRGGRGNTTLTTSWIAMDGASIAVSNNASDNTDKGTSIRAIRVA